MFPDSLHEAAAIATVVLAALWLIVHWLRIGKPHGPQPGCARCDHNALAQGSGPAPGGVRSKQLRVID